jgi:hypothetical protein
LKDQLTLKVKHVIANYDEINIIVVTQQQGWEQQFNNSLQTMCLHQLYDAAIIRDVIIQMKMELQKLDQFYQLSFSAVSAGILIIACVKQK